MKNNCHRQIIFIALVTLNLIKISVATLFSGNYNQDFIIEYTPNHVYTSPDGRFRTLSLNHDSGSGFTSKEKLLFGQFDMQIKLVPGRSAGTVVAFYLKSGEGNNRDEVDFEFLGNVIGKPYGLQTNIFSDGSGNREQRIHLWFDPTKDFHTYSILWNIYLIMFMVDRIPIRVYRNHADKGVQYPQWKPMNLVASIWNGEGWATRGGKDKIDWSKAPFTASFRNYKVDACFWRGNAGFCRANSPSNWWNNPRFSQQNPWQKKMLIWVRKYYMYYDYCTDHKRFPSLPKECTIAL